MPRGSLFREEDSHAKRPDPAAARAANPDIEQDTGRDERVPRRDGETERTVGPEDEDRRVRPGEKRT